MKDKKFVDVIYKLNKTNNNEKLFDYAVQLCLEKNLKANQEDIIKSFAQYFIQDCEFNLVKLNLFKGGRDCCGYTNAKYSELFLDNLIFTKEKNLIEDIGTLVHELEHINTEFKNKMTSFVYNEDKIFYVDSIGTDVKKDLAFALYYISPNEFNSRKVEVDFTEKFVKKLENIIENDDKFKTNKNCKFLNQSKQILERKKLSLEKNLKKFEKMKEENADKLKKIAQKHFKFIKYYDDNKNKINNKIENKLKASSRFIINYLNTYKDKEFFEEIFNHMLEYNNLLGKKDNTWLRWFTEDFLSTNLKEFDKSDIDKLMLNFNTIHNEIVQNLKVEDIIKHNLLFYGDEKHEKPLVYSFYNIEFGKPDRVESIHKKLENFKFIGIPFTEEIDRSGEIPVFTKHLNLNGEHKIYNTEREMLLDVSNYINSAMLDDLNEDTIEKINSLFDKDIIIDLSKHKDSKKDKDMLKFKQEIKESLNSKNNEEELSLVS